MVIIEKSYDLIALSTRSVKSLQAYIAHATRSARSYNWLLKITYVDRWMTN